MEPQTRTITVRDVSKKLWDKIRVKAIVEGKSVPAIVNLAFEQFLNGKAK